MGKRDIGIDLGTATVIVYIVGKGVVLYEPSIVAVETLTGKIVSVGEEAFKLLGRTPDNIRAVRPLQDGVISDYVLTEQMIKHFLKRSYGNMLFKPRVAFWCPLRHYRCRVSRRHRSGDYRWRAQGLLD